MRRLRVSVGGRPGGQIMGCSSGGDVLVTPTGRRPNMFFTNLTYKHIKLTLTGFSKRYSEWYWQKIQWTIYNSKNNLNKKQDLRVRDKIFFLISLKSWHQRESVLQILPKPLWWRIFSLKLESKELQHSKENLFGLERLYFSMKLLFSTPVGSAINHWYKKVK